ncbi:hypothetical protein PP935_gp189 [Rhizobium phage RHph_N34]|uniref:Uncharacterized protein n=1 Tax=Rhizobium phage RHph_N34 TaxID=2509586 RepID=A0A7S5RK77_9CAUD|nr:hypothetical protein PP935_gp189 [Rhizobium phage RHph_N34]QIG73964.1 hypothetical protein EVC06_189 [Rhizobium phage RHph_N34]
MKTRSGHTAKILGYGPLTKTFLLVEVYGTQYLVWEKTKRYRSDGKDHPADIIDE